ncbi:MAG TPA: cytochrome-c oxidase, cbb3-type subunit III [Steroidobacteraceae bacterium]|nr:cytochrome-c oxidase, cbb3-type subunit III [Steroidobacteraceae bacterium]
MSNAWSLYIVVLVLINVGGALWLLWWTRRRKGVEAETTGHVWDGDLTEYNNPLPRWWLWLFYLTVIFSAVYLVLYPGLGNLPGRLGWTQSLQHQQQVATAERAYAERFARVASLDISALSRDTEAMAAARNLFANNCSTCHGSDARGAVGFPNLTDADWLYGGDAATVEQTIAQGRHGVMPPWGEALSASEVEEVIAYVLALSGTDVPADMAAAGKPKFELICGTCHGVDGRGNQQLGAPNLADDIWLYEKSPDSIRQTIQKGRSNQMPAHLPLLGEQKVRMLAAYVLSLSRADAGGEGDAAQ